MDKISIIMANYCGEAYVEAAIASVLRQTHQNFELLVADDASPDGSVARISAMARQDPRVILIQADKNGGAAGARNRALDQATGDWVAIVDSDDLIHPERLARMLAAAQTHDVQMVADDLLFFSDKPSGAGRTLLESKQLTAAWRIGLAEMLGSEDPAQDQPQLGYLKVLISRKLIGDLRYDESLPVAEDFDFYVRLMLHGAQCLILPDPMYLYRRHSGSLSYRLSVEALQGMLAAHEALLKASDFDTALSASFARRKGALLSALDYQKLVQDLKERRIGAGLYRLMRRPTLLKRLAVSLLENRQRRHAETTSKTHVSYRIGPDLEGNASVAVEMPPPAGDAWTTPPARTAARLSALAAAYDLDLEVQGFAGLWALWLIPFWSRARLDLTASDMSAAGAIAPKGVEYAEAVNVLGHL